MTGGVVVVGLLVVAVGAVLYGVEQRRLRARDREALRRSRSRAHVLRCERDVYAIRLVNTEADYAAAKAALAPVDRAMPAIGFVPSSPARGDGPSPVRRPVDRAAGPRGGVVTGHRIAVTPAEVPWATCLNHCDHCRPDVWHSCRRPEGHSGFHSCQPEDIDYEWAEGSS